MLKWMYSSLLPMPHCRQPTTTTLNKQHLPIIRSPHLDLVKKQFILSLELTIPVFIPHVGQPCYPYSWTIFRTKRVFHFGPTVVKLSQNQISSSLFDVWGSCSNLRGEITVERSQHWNMYRFKEQLSWNETVHISLFD